MWKYIVKILKDGPTGKLVTTVVREGKNDLNNMDWVEGKHFYDADKPEWIDVVPPGVNREVLKDQIRKAEMDQLAKDVLLMKI